MKIFHQLCLTTVVVLCTTIPYHCPGQNLSWTSGIERNVDHGAFGVLERPDGTIIVATTIADPIRTKLIAFDWQGLSIDSSEAPFARKIAAIEGGYVLAGDFIDSLVIGGQTILGSPAFWRFYVARFNHENELLWLRYGVVTQEGQEGTGGVLDLAVSSESRIAVLLGRSSPYGMDGDSVPFSEEMANVILCLQPEGEEDWHTEFRGTMIGEVISPTFTKLAFDSQENLWMSASLINGMVISGDTVHPTSPYAYDNLILRFNGEGDVEDDLFVSGGIGGYDAIATNGMVSNGDGGMIWYGGYNNGASVPGLSLDSSGAGNNALIMKLNADLEAEWNITFGTDSLDHATSLLRDGSSDAYLLTAFTGPAAIVGSLTVPSEPGRYAVVARMSSTGTITSAFQFARSSGELFDAAKPLGIIGGTETPLYILGAAGSSTTFINGNVSTLPGYLARFDVDGTQSISPKVMQSVDLHVFPNPTSGPLALRLEPAMSGPCIVVIRSCTGAVLHNGEVTFSSGSAEVDVAHLPSGLYSIQLVASDHVCIQRVVVE